MPRLSHKPWGRDTNGTPSNPEDQSGGQNIQISIWAHSITKSTWPLINRAQVTPRQMAYNSTHIYSMADSSKTWTLYHQQKAWKFGSVEAQVAMKGIPYFCAFMSQP